MAGWLKKRSKTPARVASDTSPNGVYSSLRQQSLSANRTELGITQPSPEALVWGLIMETGYDTVTVTLFALADGTTSLYFSNGGGVIGGHNHESVRQASGAFIDQSNHSLQHLTLCQTFPIPEPAHTIFYVLTDTGILTGGALENDLGYDRHALSTLFHAGHEVITQLRLISETPPNLFSAEQERYTIARFNRDGKTDTYSGRKGLALSPDEPSARKG